MNLMTLVTKAQWNHGGIKSCAKGSHKDLKNLVGGTAESSSFEGAHHGTSLGGTAELS